MEEAEVCRGWILYVAESIITNIYGVILSDPQSAKLSSGSDAGHRTFGLLDRILFECSCSRSLCGCGPCRMC